MKMSTFRKSRYPRHFGIEALEYRAMLTTLFVDGEVGNDANPGTAAEPFATIGAAVSALDVDGEADTVEIAAGKYVENVTLNHGDALILRGASGGGDSTVVDGADSEETVIDIESGDVTIQDLIVTGSEEADGIAGDGDSLTLIDVQARRNDRGVDVKFGTVTITRGQFSDNDSDGIRVREVETFTATDVKAHRNGDEGIQIDNEDSDLLNTSVTIIGGNYSHNVDDGIAITDVADISIQDVTSSYSAEGDGLDVELTLDDDDVPLKAIMVDVAITDSDFTHNADEGAEFDDTNSVLISGGKFSKNGHEGIDVDTTNTVMLENVTVNNNNGSGLQVEAGDSATEVTILGGSYSHNALDGITIEEGGAISLTSVTGIGNGGNGLRVIDSGTLTLIDEVFKNNGDEDILEA